MNYLVFCSAEIGAQPFRIAETLNRYGRRTYYISLAGKVTGHDSTAFHYHKHMQQDWDISYLFRHLSALPHQIDQILYWPALICQRLQKIKERYAITQCFATGIKSYLLAQAGIPYRYWSYGSDLDRHCFHPVYPSHYPSWLKGIFTLLFSMLIRPNARKSIQMADAVWIAPYQQKRLARLCPQKKMFFLPHLIQCASYPQLLKEKQRSRKVIGERIAASHYFFSSTRHEWSGSFSSEADNKGNDVAIYAFKKFLDHTSRNDTKLVLVKKGTDVAASMMLVDRLNLKRQVLFIDQMSREALEQYYLGASMCLGQFGNPVLTYASLEPLSNGCPCASYFSSDSGSVPFYNKLPPIFNSKNPDHIMHFMVKCLEDTDYSQGIGFQSWKWIAENCREDRFVQKFIDTFVAS